MKHHRKAHIKTNEEMLTLRISIQSSVAIRGPKWNTFCVSDTGPLKTEDINTHTHITWIQTLQRDLWAEVFAFMRSEWMCAFGRRSCEYHFSFAIACSPALCRHLNSKYHMSNTYLNSFLRVNLFFISITDQIPSPLFLSIVYVICYICLRFFSLLSSLSLSHSALLLWNWCVCILCAEQLL